MSTTVSKELSGNGIASAEKLDVWYRGCFSPEAVWMSAPEIVGLKEDAAADISVFVIVLVFVFVVVAVVVFTSEEESAPLTLDRAEGLKMAEAF